VTSNTTIQRNLEKKKLKNKFVDFLKKIRAPGVEYWLQQGWVVSIDIIFLRTIEKKKK
jgi:hypothetical protein